MFLLTNKSCKINIPDSEIKLLQRKLEDARLPKELETTQWGETNGVTLKLVGDTVNFWRNEYDWKAEEARLNEMPQFKIPIDMDDFGTLGIHFVHSSSSVPNAVPLLFVHGWPSSFAEIQRALPALNKAGFHVVAPSLPGYGFSAYPKKAGFKYFHHAELMHKVMSKLGYEQYAVQGGDWGAIIVRCMALKYPGSIKAVHTNMVVPPL
jgi:pimeloyl-ACP methyl ester carboxylesterase